jgi:hypothetical protein
MQEVSNEELVNLIVDNNDPYEIIRILVNFTRVNPQEAIHYGVLSLDEIYNNGFRTYIASFPRDTLENLAQGLDHQEFGKRKKRRSRRSRRSRRRSRRSRRSRR